MVVKKKILILLIISIVLVASLDVTSGDLKIRTGSTLALYTKKPLITIICKFGFDITTSAWIYLADG
jgi:hypothetical protein